MPPQILIGSLPTPLQEWVKQLLRSRLQIEAAVANGNAIQVRLKMLHDGKIKQIDIRSY